MSDSFVDVGVHQKRKHGEGADGDVFLSRKTDDGRIISVLSDGLGSGIKAGVLATLTATMALRFIAEDIPPKRAAQIIMKTLPVCKERKISYATFTIVDIDNANTVRIIEYDNPPFLLVRNDTLIEPIKTPMEVKRRRSRTGSPIVRSEILHYSEYRARPGDRIVFFSDGVVQSGMGSRVRPLGWGNPKAQEYTRKVVMENPTISARDLARRLVKEAESHDGYEAKDDISCAVIYFRKPRNTLVMSGPPVDPAHDGDMATIFTDFEGRRILCGGTTANIISRELNRPVRVNLRMLDPSIPPPSTMEGADLVTEGILTLGRVAELLEGGATVGNSTNAATKLVDLLLDSDRIEFLVGTRINEAHQDPNMPVELEIRRSIVKRIARALEERYLKETSVRFI